MPYKDFAPDMPLPDALEIVDTRNRPLLVMPCAEALRQRLPHRAVALLPCLRRQFFLVRRRDLWDVAALAPLPAGESAAVTAQNLLAYLPLPPCSLHRIALLPPGEDLPCFVELFAARLRAVPAFPAAWEALPVDAATLAGFQEMPEAPLAAVLRRLPPQPLRECAPAAAAARHSKPHTSVCTRPLLATTSPPKA